MRLLLGAIIALVTTEVAAAAPARPAEFLYTVKPGDTLIGLANRGFKSPGDYLVAQRHNRIGNPRALRPGSTLRIPTRILKVRPIGAKVIAFRGDAAVGGGPAHVGQAIVEGMALRTGADAFLTIELADGSLVTLPSRSTMRVVGLHVVVLTGSVVKSFELLRGRAETDVQRARKADERFEIRTPVSVAAVRGTKFRVTFGEQSAAAGASVLEGLVGVEAGTASVAVPEGKGVVASASGPGPIVPLLSKPEVLAPGKVQDEEIVTFALAPLAGAATYRMQLAKDAGFIEIFAEAEGRTPALAFSGVPNGTLFARATGISPEGIEGFPAVFTFERRLNSIKAEVNEPDQCPALRCLRFRWRTGGEGERRYRFQLVASPGEIPIIDEPEMQATELVVTDLPGGTYYWRVESILIEGGRRQSKWTDYQELRVAPAARN
jgi:hypothetical protein